MPSVAADAEEPPPFPADEDRKDQKRIDPEGGEHLLLGAVALSDGAVDRILALQNGFPAHETMPPVVNVFLDARTGIVVDGQQFRGTLGVVRPVVLINEDRRRLGRFFQPEHFVGEGLVPVGMLQEAVRHGVDGEHDVLLAVQFGLDAPLGHDVVAKMLEHLRKMSDLEGF